LKALVIGRTGPTGHYIVNGLIKRGYAVSMLHSGNHELAEIPATLEHIHTDPFSTDAFRGAIGNRTFDLTIAAYGRLRRIAEIMAGRAGAGGNCPSRLRKMPPWCQPRQDVDPLRPVNSFIRVDAFRASIF
jgi:hypothetical protein